MPKHKTKRGFFIRNIVIIGGKKQNGEYLLGPYVSHKSPSPNDSLTYPLIFNNGIIDSTRGKRIVQHIQLLAEFAKKHHNINRLTRLVTDEFSFYTRSTPLTFSEYNTIINNLFLAFQSSSLPPNIILIISSIPVLWTDNKLRNAVLHIQSPNNNQSGPIIHHFSKETTSTVDPRYNIAPAKNLSDLKSEPINPYSFDKDDYSNLKHSPNIVLENTHVSRQDPNQYNSAIIVEPYNLPPIIDAIDICSDHPSAIAKNNVEKLLNQNGIRNIPFHISHIITSCVINIRQDNLASNAVHADRLFKSVGKTPKKTTETITSHFGPTCKAYVYRQTRAEVLHSSHLKNAAIRFSSLFPKESMPICNLKDNYGNTLLHQVFLKNKSSEFNPFFLLKQLDEIINHFDHNTINLQNGDGNTPLHLALIVTDNIDILMKLINRGAKISIQNNMKMSVLEWSYYHQKSHLMIDCLAQYKNNSISTISLAAKELSDAKFQSNMINTFTQYGENSTSLLNIVLSELIKRELQHSTHANNTNIFLYLHLLSGLNILQMSYYSHLTIAEQLIAHSYLSSSTILLTFLQQQLSQLFNRTTIDKIANTFPNKPAAQEWLYRETIINELCRVKNTNVNLLLLCVPGLSNLDQPICYGNQTIAEKLMSYACCTNQPNLLITFRQQLIKSFNTLSIDKIVSTFYNQVKSAEWFCYVLLSNEFHQLDSADLNIILSFLPRLISLNIPNIYTSMTMGEHLIMQAYYLNDTKFLSNLRSKLAFLLNQKTIDKIVHFTQNKEHIREWLNHTFKELSQQLDNDLKLAQIRHADITRDSNKQSQCTKTPLSPTSSNNQPMHSSMTASLFYYKPDNNKDSTKSSNQYLQKEYH